MPNVEIQNMCLDTVLRAPGFRRSAATSSSARKDSEDAPHTPANVRRDWEEVQYSQTKIRAAQCRICCRLVSHLLLVQPSRLPTLGG